MVSAYRHRDVESVAVKHNISLCSVYLLARLFL